MVMNRRSGATLMEVLVVFAILSVLVGLLLPAIQSARRSAAFSESLNQFKQINIAYAGLLSVEQSPTNSGILLDKLQGYIEVEKYITPMYDAIILNYVNPHDPSFVRGDYTRYGNCSLALNARFLERGIRPEQIPDGATHTIFLTERYARCKLGGAIWSLTQSECFDGSMNRIPCNSSDRRLATFADQHFEDAHPVPGPTTNTSTGSLGNLTFQVQVRENDCDGRIPQASFRNGLIVAFADGAVRTVAPNVSASTFWSAVTPNGNESLGDW
jgi:type II secretory pathway pseudopilin PulG